MTGCGVIRTSAQCGKTGGVGTLHIVLEILSHPADTVNINGLVCHVAIGDFGSATHEHIRFAGHDGHANNTVSTRAAIMGVSRSLSTASATTINITRIAIRQTILGIATVT